MIKQKLKKCRLCGKEVYLFSRGRCKPCTVKEDQYRISKENKKQYNRRKLYSNLRLQYLESHPKCEVCNTNSATEIHHKKKRTGENLFKYFCAICRDCHVKVENNPEWAYEMGYSIRVNN